MRKLTVLLLWVIATGLVIYAANAAVRAVDRQVFPDGASIQVSLCLHCHKHCS